MQKIQDFIKLKVVLDNCFNTPKPLTHELDQLTTEVKKIYMEDD